MDKLAIADLLEEIALLLELAGESPFKARAYENAARALRAVDGDLAQLVASGDLMRMPGIGPRIANSIRALAETGQSSYHQELCARVPPGLIQLLRIPNLGPKRIRLLHKTLGIASLEDLERAAQAGALATLSGIGAKLQERILESLAAMKLRTGRFLLPVGIEQAETMQALLAGHPAAIRSEIAGSVRRRLETVGNVDLVVASERPAEILADLESMAPVTGMLERGASQASARLASGMRADVRVVPERELPHALHHFTGSKEYGTAMRERARGRGLALDERGLWLAEKIVPAESEVELFAALGLAFIPPELREGRGEIEAAEKNALPRLLELSDLKGVLHTHSIYSDGVNTVREMALAARAQGFSYIGLTDHSMSAIYANGMRPETVERQREEIERLNQELDGIVILRGTECDILADGRLDYPEEILAGFDFVVGSVHSRFGMGEAQMTARVLAALESPFLDVLGHLTGRRLLVREPYPLSVSAVCQAAVERGVTVEINAHPNRLELDWRQVRAFRELGGWVSINPDAHRVEGIADVRYGVAIARKGWTTPERVLNALPLEELRARFRARRSGALPDMSHSVRGD